MCPPGRYAAEERQDECTACGVGRYANAGSRSELDCQNCEGGSQNYQEAAATCSGDVVVSQDADGVVVASAGGTFPGELCVITAVCPVWEGIGHPARRQLRCV